MGNCVWSPEPKSSLRVRAARVIGAAVRVRVIRAQAVRADGATVVETRTQVIKMEAIESRRDEIFIARLFIGSKSSAGAKYVQAIGTFRSLYLALRRYLISSVCHGSRPRQREA